MRATYLRLMIALAIVCLVVAFNVRRSVDASSPATVAAPADESSKPDAGSKKKIPPRAELEAAFAKLMSHATLDGQWRLVREGKLGPERAEKYTIGEVKKVGGDRWTIAARIQYGEKDVSIPVPVSVFWAGDTPVISVTDLWLPGLGKYTARVMIYKDTYAGSWFAPDHGGLMSGVVVPKRDEKSDDQNDKKNDDATSEEAK